MAGTQQNAQENAQTEVPIAILFADMGGSTHLYDTLGDVEAHRIAAQCLARISEEVERNGGTVIKTIGDEVMSTFPSADQASETACAIQSVMAYAVAKGQRIGVHVGFHFGPVIPNGGDVFGDAVNTAARMVGLAKSGQILTTRQTVDAMKRFARTQTRQIDRRLVKGKHEEIEIFEVIWQTAGLTTLTPIVSEEPHALQGRLIVRFGEQQYEVSQATPGLTIGRDPDNDVVVADPRASRWHARVEFRQGKFVLYDRSTNGTLVNVQEGKPIFLRREEMILPESGSIAIGESQAQVDLPIHFYYESPH